MPLSPGGIIHTFVGSIAIFFGIKSIHNNKQIILSSNSGKIYLGATVITAITALTIFKHGSFNAAHGLAVLTIIAVFLGIALS